MLSCFFIFPRILKLMDEEISVALANYYWNDIGNSGWSINDTV